MKFTVLGSCSGTEPMPGRHHASIALETGSKLYLFDAGDGCGYTAFNCGIDVTKLDAIFISHPHIDHIGGLPYLFFLIGKLRWRQNIIEQRHLTLLTPAPEVLNGIRLLEAYSPSYIPNSLEEIIISDGVVFDDGTIRVTALHNAHMGEIREPWHSFSFLIEAEGKRIIYSGDIASIQELDTWKGCDLLFMETGHHLAHEVATYLIEHEAPPKKLVFTHHGRSTLANPQRTEQDVKAIFGNASVAFDGMTITL